DIEGSSCHSQSIPPRVKPFLLPGIGLATVRELQRRGAKAVAGARDPQRMPPIEGVMTVELDTAGARSCRDRSTTSPDEISTSGVPAAIARCTSTSLQANLVTGGSLPAA